MVWPIVSVIILNMNGSKFLRTCLNSVLKSDYPNLEVILVDNASTDGSVELVQRAFHCQHNLRIIRNKRNLGFAEGNNVGAKVAKGKYVAFLNNDTKVDSEWLKELVIVMEADETIAAAQSKLLSFDGKRIDSAGDFISFYGRGWMRGKGEEYKGQYGRTDEIFSARGAGMIVRKKLLRNVGYFDPTFFMVYEDIDLCWRLRLNGYKVVLAPDSIVYHVGSGTRRGLQSQEQSLYYNSRNRLAALIKNYDLKNLLVSAIVNVLVELTMVVILVINPSRRSFSLSRLRALSWNLKQFRRVWTERTRVQHWLRKVPDKQIRELMIRDNSPLLDIIWQLFYRNSIDYDNFINSQVALRSRWVS